MLLLNLTIFKYIFFLILDQFPCKYNFSYLLCSGSACSNCTKDYGLSSLNFPQFLTITGSSFFLKLMICLVLLHFLCYNTWVHHELSDIKLTVVFYNPPFLMILVNDAKYIHFQPILSTSSSNFTL